MAKRILYCAVLTAILTSFAAGQDLDTTQYYRLTTLWQGDGHSLDVVTTGEIIRPALAPTEDTPGQMWKLVSLGGGTYRICNRGLGDAKSIDVRQEAPVLTSSGSFESQFWKLSLIEDGYFRLIPVSSEKAKSLDVANDGENRRIILSDSGVYSSQRWKLTPTGISATGSPAIDFQPKVEPPQ